MVKNEHLRVFIGETVAVMIYVTVGLCSVAQLLLAPKRPDPLAMYVGYSVGAAFSVLIAGKVSGRVVFFIKNLSSNYLNFLNSKFL